MMLEHVVFSSVNLFSIIIYGLITRNTFSIFVIVISVAEAAIVLAIVLLIYHTRMNMYELINFLNK
ncbi:unnamed protein product [Spirodela intermedia]|uniref:Uncharacterized protein n=1 Tax=Spirodela intermedia TaxID=51605 RepID=A0A7I8JBL0_SPIIN|nr:unnamed protein product [Spirodela intermedia]CAA6667115.1 unnamed protein product [Spirodela intermedia]